MASDGRRTAYVNARLLDPASGLDRPGALLVEGKRILDLGPGLFADGVPGGVALVDCGGACLAPGLIDLRVQLREPGEEHKETIESGCAAAAAGGVTSMVCLPNTTPPIDDVSVVEFIARRAREVGTVKVFAYGAATQGCRGEQIAELGILAEAGAVAFTDGVRAIANAQVMRRALSYAKTFGLLLVQHAEEPALAATGVMNEGEAATRLGLSGITAAAEAILLERDMRLVALTGARYHAAHIATADGVAIIRAAKARGLPVTCDTAPPYFLLNETAVGDYRTFARLSPPLRSEDDRKAIEAGLADGTIDCIASDHAPQDQDAKRLPFAQAEPGAVGLETLLPLALTLVHNRRAGLLDVLRMLTLRPAEIMGFPAGRLAPGAPADLVLFDPSRPWRIEPERFRSKSKNSPFDGHPTQGRVLRTVVDGATVYSAGADAARG